MARINKDPSPQSTALDRRINKVISSILSQHPSRWVSATELLIADVRRNRKGVTNLKAKINAAADARVEEELRMVDILRREPYLEPSTEDKVFMAFKTRRIARLLLLKVSYTHRLIKGCFR